MNDQITKRQYGLWQSPITSEYLSQGIRISDVQWDDAGSLVWLESRANQSVCVVKPHDGQAVRDLNSTFSVRARVGYGGGDFSVGKGSVYFVEATSGRIYRQAIEQGVPKALTPAFGSTAAPVLSPDGKWLLYIRSYEDLDSLEVVDAQGVNWPQKLVWGNDFYMQPAWHPDGDRIAWVSWDHPDMPWDATEIWIGKITLPAVGMPSIVNKQLIAGGKQISVFQPEFSPDGRYLAYISDESGWWQLYVYNLQTGDIRQLTSLQAEHAKPAWVQGMRTYAFSPDSRWVLFIRNLSGRDSLWMLDLDNGEEACVNIDPGYSSLEQISVSKNGVALIASGGGIPSRVISCELPFRNLEQIENKLYPVKVERRTVSEEFGPQVYSEPQSISWKDVDGDSAFGSYYSPQNPKFTGVGTPPLIVSIHGGPTSQSGSQFNLKAQFFTSRGFAFLDVNYRGSTGYGREYRNKLRGQWGVYDVIDAINGATYLIDQGHVDRERIVIMGGSAGGFTVYKAMEDFPEFFRAGISLYGVSNQFALAADTHKFEAHYNDSLLGPLPQAAKIYRERSPIFFAERIRRPMAIFQGEDDQVVPRRQSDEMVDVLRRNGVPVVYHVYPGEGHGFRKPETISHMYQEIGRFLRDFVIYI